MNSLDVLVIGHLERDADGSVIASDTWSTSTLIRTSDGHNIVVDTSKDFMKSAIKTSLKQIGKVFPEDVDIIVLTHAHADHMENNSLFKNAKIYVHRDEGAEIPGAVLVDKETEIAKGVRIVCTPGHTAGSISVFVDADRHYAIVGDAIPTRSNYLKRKIPAHNVDADAAKLSMDRIVAYADIIVPGHELPFSVGKH
ncbi:MAG: MBL fold metallo-hydrolase [archaeon]|nr:MBL fold metallo-hydrolase [archaeon]